jgi:hypothetical protein
MMRCIAGWLWAGVLVSVGACAASESAGVPQGSGATAGSGGATDAGGGSGGSGASSLDATLDSHHNADAPLDPDAACATATEKATLEHLPVDIIWMVDNSVSMSPAIDEVTLGLNAFAQLIGQKNLDYKVIMLSLRSKTNPVLIGGQSRYAVCIPQPLAGDANCGNGPRFFQSSIDIRSTQPLEHFLGTLGQTTGYTPGTEKGGEPWKDQLRPSASRSIVVVSDDNARLVVSDFEHFAGGKNPFNSLMLPAGILEPVWNGLFTDYVFSGIYGWGSDSDPNVKCTYPGGTQPPASGTTYTQLVQKTGGVRAQLCAGSAAWGPFFDAVAQSVVQGSKLSCELALPTPSQGTLDPNKINVNVVTPTSTTTLYKVSGAGACTQNGGWYYDDDANPTKVLLCPSSCEAAQAAGSATGEVQIDVLFGCATIVQ